MRLPIGRHFAVTWSIPDSYGGMTTALLQRSRAFARLGGVPVDVLTFDARPDYDDVRARLRERGELIDGVRLLNLYDWLREHPLPGGTLRLDRDVFTPLAATAGVSTRGFGGSSTDGWRPTGPCCRSITTGADGTLLLSDRRDARQRGSLGGRSIVLCDERGVPVRSWARIHHLYRAWLDALTAKQPSFVIVDSKTVGELHARLPATARDHRARRAQLAPRARRRAAGEIRESRRAVFERLDDFDIVAVLSERQRRDVSRSGRPPRAAGHRQPARPRARRRRAARSRRDRPRLAHGAEAGRPRGGRRSAIRRRARCLRRR